MRTKEEQHIKLGKCAEAHSKSGGCKTYGCLVGGHQGECEYYRWAQPKLVYSLYLRMLEAERQLKAWQETTCEYCGGGIGDEEIMHKKCPESPWCECGRSQLKGSCKICDIDVEKNR